MYAVASQAACCHPPLQLYRTGSCCYAGPCLPAELHLKLVANETVRVIISQAYQRGSGQKTGFLFLHVLHILAALAIYKPLSWCESLPGLPQSKARRL